ncbi:MAG TPA: RNA polymerase sigma factor [Polyangia bacterium]|jgi:RNA polymerase sigma-70 factor (ECF subfamily)|nr:RNA polymerase sigma factor [Polyangia bacterium]
MTRATAEQERIKSEYGRIVSEIQPLLIHRAMSLTRDRDYAHDLVQATLERGFRSFDRFQSGSNATSWLLTIMTHHFIDEFRHARLMRFERSIDSIEIPGPLPEETPTWAAFDAGEIERASARLSDDFRVPFQLRIKAQLSYREIATRLGISMNTVASRIHRARQQLRRLLMETRSN